MVVRFEVFLGEPWIDGILLLLLMGIAGEEFNHAEALGASRAQAGLQEEVEELGWGGQSELSSEGREFHGLSVEFFEEVLDEGCAGFAGDGCEVDVGSVGDQVWCQVFDLFVDGVVEGVVEGWVAPCVVPDAANGYEVSVGVVDVADEDG